MTTAEHIELMTLDDFINEYGKQPFELVNGEKIPLMPNVMIHQLILRTLFRLLDAFSSAHKLGEVVFELPFVEIYNSSWVKGSRTPDLMFFRAEKWAQYTKETENWLKKPSLIVPDLAVEIVSPNDSFSELQEKVDEYIERGVTLIWIFDPQKKRVHVYRDDRHTALAQADTLSGEDVLPGLDVRLVEVFSI
jgi:Uma2 family endonuclease